MPRPKLIITADDYGMSPQFNQGMLEAAESGLITGISVMIKRKYIRKTDLLELRLLLGLHLELQDIAPTKEIIHQIEYFRKRFGQLPAYLDGHQHQHLAPENLRQVIRVAMRFRLPVRSRLPDDRTLLRQGGVVTPDNFISWHPSRLPTLEKKSGATRDSLVSKLVVHPGYSDKKCRYRYNAEREEELGFLRSPRFRKLIRGFQHVSYTDISDTQHGRKTTAAKQ